MQIFAAERKIFLLSILRRWGWSLAFYTLILFCFNYFFGMGRELVLISFFVIVLIELSGLMTQFRVKKIKIEPDKAKLSFMLKSILSGQEIEEIEVGKCTAELIITSGLKKYLFTPYVLKIYFNSSEVFSISNKYGFSLETLQAVEGALMSIRN